MIMVGLHTLKWLIYLTTLFPLPPWMYYSGLLPDRLELGTDGKKQITPIRPTAVLSRELDLSEETIRLM